MINDTIQRLKKEKLLKEKNADGLKVSNPKTPKFYMQPKIHKKDNPGRPVVSSVNCQTSSIYKNVDYHLQPIVKDIPSYVRDTKDFPSKLNHVRHIPKESLLVTLDVKSLHTDIPNNEGIKAVREAYDKHPSKTVSTKVIIKFLSAILTLNYFIFNCSHYLQIMGCSMGTICAPAYANIFMAQFEAKKIYPYIHGKAPLFLGYIDDIFMIWNGTKEEVISFIGELNNKHKPKNCDYKIYKQSFWTQWYIEISNTKFRRYSVNQRTNKHTYMHNRIIPNLLKAVFHTANRYAYKEYVQLLPNSTKL